MPEQDLHATQADHAKEGLNVVTPANHQPTKMVVPNEYSLDSPAFATTALYTSVLGRAPERSGLRCDHLDAVALGQVPIQTVTVIGFVADQ